MAPNKGAIDQHEVGLSNPYSHCPLSSMGNGLHTNRYIGGKSYLKYFHDDIWQESEELCDKLGFTAAAAFLVFQIFANIDANQHGIVEADACTKFIGGTPNAFTKRVFFIGKKDNEDGSKPGFTFTEFIIKLWAFCSLSSEGLARYTFEIFDPDNEGIVEKPDLETMFRMLYGTTEHDERYLSIYPFDSRDRITKADFISNSFKKMKFPLLKPAIEYQTKIRRRIGGRALWRYLAQYRSSHFRSFDSEAMTLAEALLDIVQFEDPNRRKEKATAAALLEYNRLQVELENKALTEQLVTREAELAEEQRRRDLLNENRHMVKAKANLDKWRRHMMDTEYTTLNASQRQDHKEQLYELLDTYVNEFNEFWEWKDNKDISITEGTEGDHEYRYLDHMKTSEGKAMKQLMLLVCIYRILAERFRQEKANKSNKYLLPMSLPTGKEEKKSEKEVYTETFLPELESFLAKMVSALLARALSLFSIPSYLPISSFVKKRRSRKMLTPSWTRSCVIGSWKKSPTNQKRRLRRSTRTGTTGKRRKNALTRCCRT